MKIYVERPHGGRFQLEVDKAGRIGDILAKIQDEGFDPNPSSLWYEGQMLAKDETVVSSPITEGCTLRLESTRQVASPEKAHECDSEAKASIIDFYPVNDYHRYMSPRFYSIEDILKKGVIEQNEVPAFRWIHLPSNNMFWVERLIDLIYVEQGLKKPREEEIDSEDNRSTSDKGKGKAKAVDNDMAPLLHPHYWARQEFVGRKSQDGVQSRFMKPCFSTISNAPDLLGMQLVTPFKDQWSNSFVFMPFIDWELISMQMERERCLSEIARESSQGPWLPQDDKWKELPIGAKLLITYSQAKPPIHDRRTLDQAFYYTMKIEDAWKRDTDQVLYRYFQSTDKSEDARILMVDQLWIWIIDTPRKRDGEPERRLKTVVTAFPPRWSKKEAEVDFGSHWALLADAKSMPDAHGRILNALYSDYGQNISSATDLLCLIIDKCSALFHPVPEEANDTLSYLDVFTTGIGEQASEQTGLADSMWEHSGKLQKHLDKKKALIDQSTRELFSRNGDRTLPSRADNDIGKEMGLLSDITHETKCLKEVKDIMDELNSISYIFTQQMNVVQSMVDDAELQQNHKADDGSNYRRGYPTTDHTESSKKAGDNKPSEGHYKDLPEDMELKYKRLLSTLKKRKETITHLKDEAYRVYRDLCDLLDLKQKQATVFQAVLASQESKEAEKQGQTIMLFTIVTVIFLPLSFVAAIFSMNAREINPESKRPISEIFSIMFPLTAGILIISLLLAYGKLIKRLIIFVLGTGGDGHPPKGDDAHGDDAHGDDAHGDDGLAPTDPPPALAAKLTTQATAENNGPLPKQPEGSSENDSASLLSRRRGASRVPDVEEGR
ncbi:hypothetical protein CDV36_005242 [Fusarium kuroshium]|uniref:Ubiquitin-like domain-containing protein n=1 Tax=Fusarium kuroshium TaxID=2010991 RepID=A0A3M2SD21_9HYPO|nr:hypothetical protein CDV36_005242 [Fusarium kuroshium]